MLRQEVQDLHASLKVKSSFWTKQKCVYLLFYVMHIDDSLCVFSPDKEERWFSGELKKELDKVQGHLKQVIPS